VFPIQPVGLTAGNEKLTAVGVWAAVRHAQNARLVVFEGEVFVVESLGGVDASFPCSVSL